MRKGYCGFNRSAVLPAHAHDTAIQLSLRSLVGDQQRLPFAHRHAQQQQRAVVIYVQGVGFFMERIFPRPVPVNMH